MRRIGERLRNWCADVMRVVCPPLCPVCGNVLTEGETVLCAGCLARLEYSGYPAVPSNPMEQRLERLCGRTAPAAALLIYAHRGVSGRIVSGFKYAAKRESAVFAGTLLGRALRESGRFGTSRVLVPVPLHPSRLRRRGYNQAEELCRGIRSVWPLEMRDVLVRTTAAREQASLGREERLSNVADVFALRQGCRVEGEDVLLVDDVFTTGATAAAAVRTLYRAGARSVAVACLCAGA